LKEHQHNFVIVTWPAFCVHEYTYTDQVWTLWGVVLTGG